MSHDRVATISRPTARDVARVLGREQHADLIEVRLDVLWSDVPDADQAADDLATILEATDTPLLATLRPKRQGGAFEGDEVARINLLMAAAQAGFAAVDIEDDHQEVGRIVEAIRPHAELVLSDHRFIEAPSREIGLRHLQSQQDLRGRYDKIAFPTGNIADRLRALELAHSHAHRNGKPAIAPIGGDALFRALLPLAGNHATYGSADGSPAAVRGQPELQDIQDVWNHWGIGPDDLPGDAEAGWYAVLGDPVAHSDSPCIHNAMLRHAGRPERFGALQVPDSLPIMRLVMSVAPRIGLRGGSITMPLKRHAHKIAGLDDVARATGAVNCFRVDARGVHGTNTDATAMKRLLDGAGSVAILGAGGAARAAIWAAHQLGLPCTFTSRDPDNGRKLAAETGATWSPWKERHDLRADTWVHATPLGSDDESPLESIDGDHVIELVYRGGRTPLERLAKSAGLRITSGRDFLIEQGLDAFRYWTRTPGDRNVMEASL